MISRLPDHFYAMVHCLEGKDALYQNPGTSLRSFVVKELRNELVVVPEHLHETIRECEQFSSSLMVAKTIVELLINRATRTIADLNEVPKKQKPSKYALTDGELVNYATRLHTQGQIIKTQFESIALQAADDSLVEIFTHDNLVGQHFKQALFEMKYLQEEVIDAIELAVTDAGEKA